MDGANVQFWLQNIDRFIENVNLRDKILLSRLPFIENLHLFKIKKIEYNFSY